MKTETKVAHTPTPWKLEETELCLLIRDEIDEKEVALISPSLKDSPREMETHRANAAYIVKCVNAHEQLLKALREVCNDEENNKFVLKMSTMKIVRQAIANAEETGGERR